MRKHSIFSILTVIAVLLCIAVFYLSSPPPSYSISAAKSALAKIQKRGVVSVGWAKYPPYHDFDPKTKKHVGAAVDLGEELGKFMDVKVQWVEDSWATLIAGVYAGKFDLVIPMDRTHQRYMAAGLSDWLAYSAQVLMTQKKDEARIKHFRDANDPGIRVSCALGSASDTLATAVYDKAKIVRVPGTSDALLQLVAGKVDAFVITVETASRAMREYPQLRVADGIMTARTNGFVTRPDDQVFINFLNFFIQEKRMDGTLKRIWKKWGLPEYLVEPEWKQPR